MYILTYLHTHTYVSYHMEILMEQNFKKSHDLLEIKVVKSLFPKISSSTIQKYNLQNES